MVKTLKTPRGIRNNNPLNIRIGNSWQGEVENPTDKKFEQFTQMEYGLRAGFYLLRRYISRYHLNTISDIIKRWAPTNENNTENYIKRVSLEVGLSPYEPIRFEDKETMCKIVNAMVFVENGQRVNMELIERGYDIV